MENRKKARTSVLIVFFMTGTFICARTHALSADDISYSAKPACVVHGETDLLPNNPLGTAATDGSRGELADAVDLITKGLNEQAENILSSLVEDPLEKEKAYFLLGRLFKDRGFLERAEDCFRRASVEGFILRDYALRSLAYVHIDRKEFSKAVEVLRQIKNEILLREAERNEISSLLELQDEKAATEALSRYIGEYPHDWEYKMLLARLLKERDRGRATGILKDVYVNAVPLSGDALKELNGMNASQFTAEERLFRADNLLMRGSFKSAEVAFKKLLRSTTDPALRDRIRFSIGTCQFKRKKYGEAAESFRAVRTAEGSYWEARAVMRRDIKGLEKTIGTFKRDYPGSEYIAELLLSLADEKRRDGRPEEAERIFKEVLKDFPGRAEDALWGLGWMKYMNRSSREAVRYFSELASYVKSREHPRYLYWWMRSLEEAREVCEDKQDYAVAADSSCRELGQPDEAYSRLSADPGYYGFLARMRSKENAGSGRIEMAMSGIPGGEMYQRIELLRLFGMRQEAVTEIKKALKHARDPGGIKYLAVTAFRLGEYKSIIPVAVRSDKRDFLPLAYPLGFWSIVSEAAEKESVDAYLVVALIREESRFDPDAVSAAGAIGLMQLMPFTAHRVKKGLGIVVRDDSEIHDIRKNIHLGTHYLSSLIKEFGEIPFAIASYNAGERALRQWLMKSDHRTIEEFIEDIPYRETRGYVKNVLRSYWQYRVLEGLPPVGI